jgi:hypothetical protein
VIVDSNSVPSSFPVVPSGFQAPLASGNPVTHASIPLFHPSILLALELNYGLGAVEKFELVKPSKEMSDGPSYTGALELREINEPAAHCVLSITGEGQEQTNGEEVAS